MGPNPTASWVRRGAGRELAWLGLSALGLAACASDDGRPPPPVSGIGMDEAPSITDDAGSDTDSGSVPDAGRTDGGLPPGASDAGPRPDAPLSSDPALRRLVVSDHAGKVLVFDMKPDTPELPAPVELEVPEGAHIVAGARGRYAYVFVPGEDEVRVLDVGMHSEGGRNVLTAPAFLDVTLTGDAVASVMAGSADGETKLAVAFSGRSAPLFATEPTLSSAKPAQPWAAGQLPHAALAFFVGDLAVRSVATEGGTALELVDSGDALDCADPSSVVASGRYAVVACADGTYTMTRSVTGIDRERVAASTSFTLGAANEGFYAVVSEGTLSAAPWPASKDGARAFVTELGGSAPVALQLTSPEDNVGVWALDASGSLKRYDASHLSGFSELATGCATPATGLRPGLWIDGGVAFITCPATGKLLVRSTTVADSEPVQVDAGRAPSELLVFGYAP